MLGGPILDGWLTPPKSGNCASRDLLASGKTCFRTEAVLMWKVSGALAQRAAAALIPFTPLKARLLELATSRLPAEEVEQLKLRQELSNLKQQQPKDFTIPGWNYFAGHFDAGGCCTLSPSGDIALSIRRKSHVLPEAVHRFLQQEGIDKLSGRSEGQSQWKCNVVAVPPPNISTVVRL